MLKSSLKTKKKLILLGFQILAISSLGVLIIIHPDQSFNAALIGIQTWLYIVFPALIPFFIVSEILMGLGLVHFIGVILEPVMKPTFNVSGSGAFVFAVGYTSGAPIGAVLTRNLRKQGLCTKTEGERLLAFTNNASPLFMLSAISVGMLKNAKLGFIIASTHYIANIIVGLLMRFYKIKQDKHESSKENHKNNNSIFYKALKALIEARKKDGRNFGQLLNDAIRNSIQTLLLIGGFIIIFSVIIKILTIIGFVNLIASYLEKALYFLGLNSDLYYTLTCGFIEMTVGSNLTSQINAPLSHQLIIISITLGFLGLSVLAQVVSIISDTDLNIIPYIIARILHAFFSCLIMILLLKNKTLETLNYIYQIKLSSNPFILSLNLLYYILLILFIFCLLIILVNYFTNLFKKLI